MTPREFFSDFDLSEVSEWSKFARYHDVHVSESDYIVTYLDPTIYTAWSVYNTQKAVPWDYIEKLQSWNYRVCYFTQSQMFYYTHPVKGTEALSNPVTMGLSSDLFPDMRFTHRYIL